MAAEQATRPDRPSVSQEDVGATAQFSIEHLSILPVTAAAAAVVSGAEWAWPAAAMFLAVAYLSAYIGAR